MTIELREIVAPGHWADGRKFTGVREMLEARLGESRQGDALAKKWCARLIDNAPKFDAVVECFIIEGPDGKLAVPISMTRTPKLEGLV